MNKPRKLFLSLPLFPLLAGCGAVSGEADMPLATSEQALLLEGTPASEGVLAFLNHPSTTLAVLDNEVPLETRAAQNLLSRRNGPDGVAGTADDQPFLTVAQVDAVAYVGTDALDALDAYARGTGWTVLEADEWLGTFDGVTFNAAEARRVLAVANTASATVLSQSVGLDSRTVQSILAARPIDHMVELSRLYWMGGAHLGMLKSFVSQAPEGDPCTGASTCQPGLSCVGIPHDLSSPYGRCRDLAFIPGDGDSCTASAPCGPDLACTGLTLWTPGQCRPAWMAESFPQYADLGLPASTVTMSSPRIVVGQATVPVDLEVELALGHSAPANLVLTLEDPNGDTALVWDGPNEGPPPARIPVTRGISRDDSVNGRWRLHVTNPSGVGSGTLRSWTLHLTSRWD